MLMIEPHETKLIIDSLMLMREDDIESGWGEDNRVMTLLRRIITHGRVPYCKRIAPDAYNLCYPDGPDYAEELASDRFREGRAFMMIIEPPEIEVIIDSLMLMREHDIDIGHSEDHRIKPLLRRIMSHAGLPHCEEATPNAYNLCYPDGPPRTVGTYGKHNRSYPDGPPVTVETYGKHDQ